MSKGNLYTIPSTGEIIVIRPISMTSEMMLATDDSPPPLPPLLESIIAGVPTQERNGADPNYLEAYKNWDNLLQFDVMKRIMYDIAIEQDLTPERQEWIDRYRTAMSGVRKLPQSDHILWFFKRAIGIDQDMQDIAKACSRLADPQEDRIVEKQRGF